MPILFLISILGMISMVPLHFLSVEHTKLHEKYGEERGTSIGVNYGLISGWGFFFFWTGIWISPQPRFTASFLQNQMDTSRLVGFPVSLLHLAISVPLILAGCWLAVSGLREVTLRVSETHRAEKVVTTGVYSIVRHPQYLGGILAHVGISFLLSGWFSLLSTPLVSILVYLISKKEEEELIKEFGEEYEHYKKEVPMFIPRLGEQDSSNSGERNRQEGGALERQPTQFYERLMRRWT